MRLLSVLASLLPAAALAHPGEHLHPHGVGEALTALLVASGAGLAAWLVLRR